MFGSRDTNFRPFFWVKSAFLGPNSSRADIFTAKPMVLGCVQHYSTHFVKKLGKSLVVFRKVQKPAKNGKKWQKITILAKSTIFRKKAAL